MEGLNDHSTLEVRVTLLKSVETLIKLAKTLWFYWYSCVSKQMGVGSLRLWT